MPVIYRILGGKIMAYVPYIIAFGAATIAAVSALIYMLAYKDDHKR